MNLSRIIQTGIFLSCFFRSTTGENGTDDFYAVRGENVSIVCPLCDTQSSFTLSWRLNGHLIVVHDPLTHGGENSAGSFTSTISTTGTTLKLEVTNVQFSEAGVYSCTKDFRSSGLPLSRFRNLFVQDIPLINMKSNVFIENSAVLAECCVEFSLAWTDRNITWMINGDSNTVITTSLPKTSSTESSERVCSTVTFQSSRIHNGKYLQCLAENRLHLSSSSLIIVQYPSKVKVLSQTYLIVMKNSTINITCAAEGYPVPGINLQFNVNDDLWYNMPLQGKLLSTTKETIDISFYFVFTQRTNSVFRCEAFNTIGSVAVSKEVMVDTYFPAKVEMITASPIVFDKTYILIECRASGVPPPDISLQIALAPERWGRLPFQPLNNKGTSTWLFNVSQEYIDEGSRYRCIANNTVDEVATSNPLAVQARQIQVTSGNYITDQVGIFIIAFIVIVITTVTGFCGRYCQARSRSRSENLAETTTELTAGLSYETIPTQEIVNTRAGTYEVNLAAFQKTEVEGLGYSTIIPQSDGQCMDQ